MYDFHSANCSPSYLCPAIRAKCVIRDYRAPVGLKALYQHEMISPHMLDLQYSVEGKNKGKCSKVKNGYNRENSEGSSHQVSMSLP